MTKHERTVPDVDRIGTLCVRLFEGCRKLIRLAGLDDYKLQPCAGMHFSLISRELIADSVEAIVRGHQFDGIFAIGGCDKNLPGLMMGMVRCNVPAIFLHGGATLPGRVAGRDVNVVDTYEAIGGVLAGSFERTELERLTRSCLPTSGSCPGQFTANTMGMVSEAIGLAPLGSSFP
jgi:dihydroxy-acid dehydratase